MKKVFYYENFDDDLVQSKKQNYKLKKNYKWIHPNIFYKFFSYLFYYLFLGFSFIYGKFVLKVKIVNKKVLKKYSNYFVYANHTLELGDPFNPLLICFPKRPYIICGQANLGIPILGKLIPILGGLVIPDDIHSTIKFNEAVNYYSKKHPIIIYPEAHLWPYYTKIRPFSDISFTYPIRNKMPCFVFTTTYQEGKKKPKITIYIDGPFFPEDIPLKEARKNLRDKVYNQMIERSKESNFEYIKYQKKSK